MFSLICARIIGSVNNREPGDLIRHRAHYNITVMYARSSDTHMHLQLKYHWFR